MITKRSEAQTLINTYKELLQPIVGKPCTLSFSQHSTSNVIVEDIELTKTTGMLNAPAKRNDGDKKRTPMIFQLTTNQCVLLFVIDDTTVSPLLNGIRFRVNTMNVDIRRMQ